MVSEGTKSKKQRMDECIINCLPEDLIERIFANLPVSVLLRCIGVCKKWHSFIQYFIRDPQFVTSHLQHAPRCALLFFPQELVLRELYPADAVLIDEAGSQSTWSVPVIGPDDFLFGSCNGLIGLYTRTPIIKIANLATGECLHLEKPVKNLRGDHFSYYNFGFHPTTKEYKITHFLSDYIGGEERSNVIQVYTLGDEKWKDVRTPVPVRLNWVNEYGVVIVDGTMYWLSDYIHDGQCAVMSFDLSDESFARIQLPAELLEGIINHKHIILITEIDGMVSIATARKTYLGTAFLSNLQIWTLDNKVEQRWSQKHNVQFSSDFIPGPHFVHGDKILTQTRSCNLFSCQLLGEKSETKSKKVRLFDFEPRRPESMQCYIFVKSLVQLDVYRTAGIVRKPKQRDGWELKRWQAWEQELCKIEDSWSYIHKQEHSVSVLAHELGINDPVVQHLSDDIQRICLELNQMLKHILDDPDQGRSLWRLNLVGRKQDREKLMARSEKIDDIKKLIAQAESAIRRIQGMPDQGTSRSTAGVSNP